MLKKAIVKALLTRKVSVHMIKTTPVTKTPGDVTEVAHN
jgi:hypothetical protein